MQHDDNQPVHVEHANLLHYVECLVLRWLGKGNYYEIPLKIIDQNGEEHEISVTTTGLNERHAVERARQIGMQRRFSDHSDQDLGFIFPKRRAEKSAKKKQGWVSRRLTGVKNKAKSAYFHDGMPRPLSLTNGHIEAMLKNKSPESIPDEMITPLFVMEYIKRCLVISLIWICVIAISVAITLAGLHDSHIKASIFGWFNPLFLFGMVSFIVGALGLLHSVLARKKAIKLLHNIYGE